MQTEWVFEAKMDEHVWIFIDSSVSDIRFDVKAYADYAGLIKINGRGSILFGGTCFVRATETPFAYAIGDAIKICREIYQSSKPLRIWTRNNAVRIYLNEYAPKWDMNFGRNSRHRLPEGKSEWIFASRYREESGIIIERTSAHYLKDEFDRIGSHLGNFRTIEHHHTKNVIQREIDVTRWVDRSRLIEDAMSAL